jgi:metal-responsive CopG/Arc/MetJ family transcriptional regulator
MVRKRTETKPILLRLDPELATQIDAIVADNDLSRNETIIRMIRHALACKARTDG